MNPLSENLRARAAEQREAAKPLYDSLVNNSIGRTLAALAQFPPAELPGELAKLAASNPGINQITAEISVTVANTTANILDALADIAESSAMTGVLSEKESARQARSEFNLNLNKALARGDYAEFDRLASEFTRRSIDAGGGAGPRTEVEQQPEPPTENEGPAVN